MCNCSANFNGNSQGQQPVLMAKNWDYLTPAPRLMAKNWDYLLGNNNVIRSTAPPAVTIGRASGWDNLEETQYTSNTVEDQAQALCEATYEMYGDEAYNKCYAEKLKELQGTSNWWQKVGTSLFGAGWQEKGLWNILQNTKGPVAGPPPGNGGMPAPAPVPTPIKPNYTPWIIGGSIVGLGLIGWAAYATSQKKKTQAPQVPPRVPSPATV